MKRLHVHVSVRDLDRSIRFYSQLFTAEPTVRKHEAATPCGSPGCSSSTAS
jgi:catechol 2,3-dioxygenase-like lactoylglutathione lyase family enzyme